MNGVKAFLLGINFFIYKMSALNREVVVKPASFVVFK